MSVTAASLYDVIDGSWPAAQFVRQGPWLLRQGCGGGSRVSAATCIGPVTAQDIAQAEDGMRAMGQKPLFMIRDTDGSLDRMLAERGYDIVDPVIMYACPIGQLTDVAIPRVTAFAIWEPLAIMEEIWAAGGIGAGRLAVMHRAAGPKTAIFGRIADKPAGAAFVAIHNGIAMIHAIEVVADKRKLGMAKWLVRAAAKWAEANGAHSVGLVCTAANTAANRLYTSLGMAVVGHYHYRHPANQKDKP